MVKIVLLTTSGPRLSLAIPIRDSVQFVNALQEK